MSRNRNCTIDRGCKILASRRKYCYLKKIAVNLKSLKILSLVLFRFSICSTHPDDECMFFAPTILNLLRQSCHVYLLCLSSGGFYNESSIRKEELRQSCKILGIPAGNLIIIEHSQLPDDPEMEWSRLKVISFDQSGVSGHLNHIAVNDGLQYLSLKGLLSQDCEVFLLKTVFLLQKYLGFLLVPLIYLCANFQFASTFHDVKIIWKSMKEHKSQFVWFRKLYIIFSQYVYMNTFIKLQNQRFGEKYT
ncbi:n-acetylglucosaminyl-phosphatidylinositol de-N-acetylase [Nephila pilipes]|uniref:N-acetylglucosaminylphosphatidylinositol deacetylase n=1 Tax=Nephila pilipes TaxID=299642 RepID=A0A8X6MR07_NEPPI|nr:n-acetylglucosaminyl-phosphatidylinositol de-N-acetylase [Nephila pilipes]